MHHIFQQVFLLSVVVVVVLLITTDASAAATTTDAAIAKPGCQDTCGNISVPYPFGIGSKNCYLDEFFEVICNQSVNPPVLYYSDDGEYKILELSLDYVRMLSGDGGDCYNQSTGASPWSTLFGFDHGPFTYFATRNKFTAIGCDFLGSISPLDDYSSNYVRGCATFCNSETFTKHNNISNSCSGNGCCQTSIPKGLPSYLVTGRSIDTNTRLWKSHPCSYGFIVENDYYAGFDRLLRSTITSRVETIEVDGQSDLKILYCNESIDVPVILDWAIGNKTCREVRQKIFSNTYICGVNSHCVDSKNGPGYKCRCSQGYQGNPYLHDGCQDIDECKDSNKNLCPRDTHCTNRPGDYRCDCPSGYKVYGAKLETSCKHIKTKLPVGVVIPIGIGTGIMFVLLVVLSIWFNKKLEERKRIILKNKYFEKNGGLLMKQKVSSHDGGVEKARIFAIQELEKATDNFNQSRILGKGGFGTVYKGMLSDGRIVAIKKSQAENENQVDQFINEVVILSQINHRHIVRLLGCCLETQVPLLVYEYVSNGTLSQHLHIEGNVPSISWKDRLRIGTEVAGALAYLHSDASVPIFHRDMKSSNILLDEGYRAKVSDFGLSRSVPIEETHLTTMVQGTFGYLDPEYFHSRQYTDKSDVYSFGVVLVELITSERAVSLVRPGESLVMQFISALKEDRLFEIIEASIVNEGYMDEVMVVAKIAKSCLKLNGKRRPPMKEVAASLERLRKYQEQPWIEPNKLQMEDFVVGETSLPCTTGTIFEVDDYGESSSFASM